MRFAYRCFIVFFLATFSALAQINSGIQLPVTVLAKQNSHATLDKSTLRVLIDKNPAQVGDVIVPQNNSLDFVVAVDLSGSTRERVDYIKGATVKLFEALESENGKGFLLLLGENIVISSRPLSIDAVKQVLDSVKPRGGSPIYDSIIKASETLSKLPSAASHRRAIVLISDGEDNESGNTRQQAIEVALQRGIPVFAIYPTGKAEGRGRIALQETTRATGGQYFDPGQPIDAVPKVADMLMQQYLVEITPPTLSGKDHHSLKIESSLKVLAPEAYVSSTR